MSDVFLSEGELVQMTGYKRPAFQLRMLESLGIPAKRRPDNSILVMRMHCLNPANIKPKNEAPRLKSSKS